MFLNPQGDSEISANEVSVAKALLDVSSDGMSRHYATYPHVSRGCERDTVYDARKCPEMSQKHMLPFYPVPEVGSLSTEAARPSSVGPHGGTEFESCSNPSCFVKQFPECGLLYCRAETVKKSLGIPGK